ncbi:hypothetical protein [Uliginosibacterium gangwonense]|uniref:hypothetical protein n=1 Tax=Uliginosibacterium gangwonense TaxID=392736 RepID=UPI000366430A|nr:hypothetical protein [Uliginosibacterium gangwonense]
MTNRSWLILAALSLSCLAGCENQAASYMVGGDKNHSISFLREQRWFWSGEVEQRIVVARFPECQRRYDLDLGTKPMADLELYEVRPMLYAAHQGNTWYALGTEQCQVQKFDQAPNPMPGVLLGRFKQKGDALAFEPNQSAPAK